MPIKKILVESTDVFGDLTHLSPNDFFTPSIEVLIAEPSNLTKILIKNRVSM